MGKAKRPEGSLRRIALKQASEANRINKSRTSEQHPILDTKYLPVLRVDGIPVTAHDRREIEFRGLQPMSHWHLPSNPGPPTGARSLGSDKARSATPNWLRGIRPAVQTVGTGTGNVRVGNELWNTVQTVRSNDARFGEQGYQSLRSSERGSEREEGEENDDKRKDGKRKNVETKEREVECKRRRER